MLAILAVLIFLLTPSSCVDSDYKCAFYGLCIHNENNITRLVPCIPEKRDPKRLDTNQLDNESLQEFKQLCGYDLQQPLCCDFNQVKYMLFTLSRYFKPWFGHCPTCYENIASLFCEVTCDPYQGYYVSASSSLTELNSWVPVNIFIDIDHDYPKRLFESCADVPVIINKSIKAVDGICEEHMCSTIPNTSMTKPFYFMQRLFRDYPIPSERTKITLVSSSDGGYLNEQKSLNAVVLPCYGSSCPCPECSSVCSDENSLGNTWITPTSYTSGASKLCSICSFINKFLILNHEQ